MFAYESSRRSRVLQRVHPELVRTSAWPLFDLRVTTPELTLRLATDAELMRLADRAFGL